MAPLQDVNIFGKSTCGLTSQLRAQGVCFFFVKLLAYDQSCNRPIALPEKAIHARDVAFAAIVPINEL